MFLGAFSNPPTASQRQLVSQWDLLILDPAQAGVKDVISSQHLSTHIVGRLDVNMTVRRDTKSSNNGIVPSLDRVVRAFMATFKRPQDTHSPFSGVLLADWQAHFRPVIFNELIRFIRGTGFAVYLEISDPDFIPEKQSRAIDMGLISGVVCRNGTILPSGESRNYFQMGDERPALRALAAHQSMTPSIVMMWEIFDENVDHAVIKRSFDWCRFNSVISWIGPRAALTDAEVAATSTVTGEPLGALMWLKGDGVIESHDTWRTNVKVNSLGSEICPIQTLT